MKILFVKEVLGLGRLHSRLGKENEELRKKYLMELISAGYMEDISDVFPNDEDREIMRTSDGILESEGKLYNFPCSWDAKSKCMRTEEKGIEIIERYNSMLNKPINISSKELKEEDYERVTIIEWEDGSEGILFNE